MITYSRLSLYLLILLKSILSMEQNNLATTMLTNIITEKKTLLGLSINLPLLKDILPYISQATPYICCIKISMEALNYNDKWNTINTIKTLSIQDNVMLIVEEKNNNYTENCTWADFTTASNLEEVEILKIILLEEEIKAPRGVFVKVQELNRVTPHATNVILEQIKNKQDAFITGIMHITDISYKNINKIKISQEEMPLNLHIERLQSLIEHRIALRRTDICLLNVSNSFELSKVPYLAKFYFDYYESTNFIK